jgi:outer membrane receptor protein involved in Fe transport
MAIRPCGAFLVRIALAVVLLSSSAFAQSGVPLSGTVVDSSGAPIPDASVRLEVAGVRIDEVRTANNGRFEFRTQPADNVRLVVTAAGFGQVVRLVDRDGSDLQVMLQPASVFEQVNVTSTRADIARTDPTVSMTVVSSAELLTSGAITLDDALKAVPSFTLFRRTSSRVSNPTAQGITLRGLGGSGSSRALVLGDGMPLNDAFGGWVYWDKIPQAAIDRVEVLRGSGSDLYGADAVGGVVQILTIRPSRPMVRALLEGGDLGTGRVSLFGGGRRGGLTYSAAGQWFTTDGYITVAKEQDAGIAPRGPIDTKAGSNHRSALASVGYQTAKGWRFDGRGSVFWEDRLNGTPAVVNDTDARQGWGEASGGAGGGLLSLRVYGGTQGYDQTFASVNATRTAETLIRAQRVPTRLVGFSGQWVRPMGRHSLLVGAEERLIKGSTIETPYTALGVALPTTDAGGTQRVGSAFVQATLAAGDRLTIVAGAHGDGWHTESEGTAYSKTLGSFNPRASFAYRIGDSGVSVRGSVYKGYRAPTLNELYRGFRAGNTVTLPNEALAPERLTGADGGVLVSRGRVSARVTGFWNVLDDAITNITLSTTPALITKQRANADKVRATGVEFESDLRLPRSFSLSFASAIVNSRFKGETSLRDNRVPQVARYNVGLTARYDDRAWAASAQLRVTGPQFEDDQNAFTLRRATVVDLYGGRTVGQNIRPFVAIENVFDAEYDVGRTPFLTIGLPRTVRAGVQITLP